MSNADWFPWVVHFVLGGIVGAGVGLFMVRQFVRHDFLDSRQLVQVVIGMALCCGSFVSYHGDRAWMPPSIFDRPQSPLPRAAGMLSIIIGIGGIVLASISVAAHVLTPSSSDPSASHAHVRHGFGLIQLLIAAIPGFLLFHALRTGTAIEQFGNVDRNDSPFAFWIYVLVNAVFLICIVFG
jgi:hypothetical protein